MPIWPECINKYMYTWIVFANLKIIIIKYKLNLRRTYIVVLIACKYFGIYTLNIIHIMFYTYAKYRQLKPRVS